MVTTAIHPSADAARALEYGTHGDPFSVLGPHRVGERLILTAIYPNAATLSAVINGQEYPLDRHPAAPSIFSARSPIPVT